MICIACLKILVWCNIYSMLLTMHYLCWCCQSAVSEGLPCGYLLAYLTQKLLASCQNSDVQYLLSNGLTVKFLYVPGPVFKEVDWGIDFIISSHLRPSAFPFSGSGKVVVDVLIELKELLTNLGSMGYKIQRTGMFSFSTSQLPY